MKMFKICFIGAMGCGKSTLARKLAVRMGMPMLDIDSMLVAMTGKTIPDVFAQDGESIFRRFEKDLFQRLIMMPQSTIIATGGGIVIDADNRSLLKQENIYTIWLRADAEVLVNRIAGDKNRPLIQDFDPLIRTKELLKERNAFYEECSDLCLDSGMLDEVALIESISNFITEKIENDT
ncbi:MAG: shikimate kinase [Mariprofundales bacterium]